MGYADDGDDRWAQCRRRCEESEEAATEEKVSEDSDDGWFMGTEIERLWILWSIFDRISERLYDFVKLLLQHRLLSGT